MAFALVLLSELRNQPVTRFSLTEGKFVCGRSSECDFVLFHRSVSRRHAQIEAVETCITVRDLGSRNGTFLNGTIATIPSRRATLTIGQAVATAAKSVSDRPVAFASWPADRALQSASIAWSMSVSALS